jgi:protease IV
MGFKRVVVGFLAIFGTVMFALFGSGLFLAWYFWSESKPAIPEKVILEADFGRTLVEYAPEDTVTGVLVQTPTTVLRTVEALERASRDDRVRALLARVGVADMGLGKIQEIRNAVLAFRSKGKFAVAYAQTLGEAGPGNGAYYLATAFDEIYLQPSGDLGLTGLMIQSPFVLGTLEKLGIAPRLDRRGKYKTAVETFTERKYSDANRESVTSIMESRFRQITRSIAERRGIPEKDVPGLIDRGPFLGKDAVEAKLLDGLAYRDEVIETVMKKAGPGAELFSLDRYGARNDDKPKGGPVIALIYGVGPVHQGKSSHSRFLGEASMGSDTVSAAFRAAVKDKDVRAVLFRVDSPGGSYVASDTIWRETVRAKEAHKPVVVSMGELAASGGYFVSSAAEKIVAQPATLTGSIGVFGGKAVTRDFWDKIGVTWDEVHTSDHSTMWSSIKDFTPEEWKRIQEWLDRVYDDFTGKVAEGRKLPMEKVLEAAQGRVWTGEDALRLGLVDELGGFPEALTLAKKAAGIPEDARVRLKLFPKKKSLAEKLMTKLLGEEDENDDAEDEVSSLMALGSEVTGPLIQFGRTMGLISKPDALMMPASKWGR